MEKHCIIAACVLAVSIMAPLIECTEHKNCHIHHDEPTKSYTFSSLASSGTVDFGTATASPSPEIPEE